MDITYSTIAKTASCLDHAIIGPMLIIWINSETTCTPMAWTTRYNFKNLCLSLVNYISNSVTKVELAHHPCHSKQSFWESRTLLNLVYLVNDCQGILEPRNDAVHYNWRPIHFGTPILLQLSYKIPLRKTINSVVHGSLSWQLPSEAINLKRFFVGLGLSSKRLDNQLQQDICMHAEY